MKEIIIDIDNSSRTEIHNKLSSLKNRYISELRRNGVNVQQNGDTYEISANADIYGEKVKIKGMADVTDSGISFRFEHDKTDDKDVDSIIEKSIRRVFE